MDQGPLTLALSREGNGDVTVYLVRIPFPLAGEGWGEGAYTPSSTSTPQAFSAIASVM